MRGFWRSFWEGFVRAFRGERERQAQEALRQAKQRYGFPPDAGLES